MKSYTVEITRGTFGLSKGKCITKTYYGIKAENMEQADAIAEKKYEEEFPNTKEPSFWDWLFAKRN